MNDNARVLESKISRVLKSDRINDLVEDMSYIGEDILQGGYSDYERKIIREHLDKEYAKRLTKPGSNLYNLLAFLQVRVLLEPKAELYHDFLECIYKSKMDTDTTYMLWAQCRGMQFVMPSIVSPLTQILYFEIFERIVSEFGEQVCCKYERIPIEKRAKDSSFFDITVFNDDAWPDKKLLF